MAVDPTEPFSREEMYLAAAAGEGVEVPPCPWSRKEAYLDQIGGRLDDMDTRIAALATDISFKGSVATEDDLPSGAAVGDAYITEDTGVMYVWVGDSWVALGGTGINVVQTTGTSQTDVMSQNATTSMVYADPSTKQKIQIGAAATTTGAYSVAIGSLTTKAEAPSSVAIIGNVLGNNSYSSTAIGNGSIANAHNAIAMGEFSRATAVETIAIGSGIGTNSNTKAQQEMATAIGARANASTKGSVALGGFSYAQQIGEMNIGSTNTSYGYNSSTYRLLTGLYDPQTAHDAATKGYVDGLVGNIETALNAINNGTGV